MTKRKRKLTPAEKAERDRRKAEYMTIFVGGKQKRVKRDRYLPQTIEGVPFEDFIRANADPIWLLQNEMWEELHVWEQSSRHEEYLEDGRLGESLDEHGDRADRESNSA